LSQNPLRKDRLREFRKVLRDPDPLVLHDQVDLRKGRNKGGAGSPSMGGGRTMLGGKKSNRSHPPKGTVAAKKKSISGYLGVSQTR